MNAKIRKRVGIAALVAYILSQSFFGRAEITSALYQDCLMESRERAKLAANPAADPATRQTAAALSAPTEDGRRALCRERHPRPNFRPF